MKVRDEVKLYFNPKTKFSSMEVEEESFGDVEISTPPDVVIIIKIIKINLMNQIFMIIDVYMNIC